MPGHFLIFTRKEKNRREGIKRYIILILICLHIMIQDKYLRTSCYYFSITTKIDLSWIGDFLQDPLTPPESPKLGITPSPIVVEGKISSFPKRFFHEKNGIGSLAQPLTSNSTVILTHENTSPNIQIGNQPEWQKLLIILEYSFIWSCCILQQNIMF